MKVFLGAESCGIGGGGGGIGGGGGVVAAMVVVVAVVMDFLNLHRNVNSRRQVW